jgi:2-keto-4-pentenoate hydratase
MRAEDVHHGHVALQFADFVRPGVECEVAVRLAHDLPPGPCSLEQALAAVGDFFAAIEVVESRYGDVTALGTPTLVADQMYHCAAVIGDRHGVDWRALDIGALHGRIGLDGGIEDQGVTTDLLGHPLNGLAWLAGSVEAAAFGGLKAGQIVMLGSVTPPVWLTEPATVTVAFPPLPAVTVRLA